MIGIYRHYKGPLYVAVATAKNSNNAQHHQRVVIYFSFSRRQLCVRDEEEFNEVIEWPDGTRRPRFERVGA
jgi:hypothetical protein